MESKEEILKAMGGIPEEVYDAIVVSFYEEAREKITEFVKAIEMSDFGMMARLAHGLKGSAANLRLFQIQDIAKELEIAAKAKNKDLINTLFMQLKNLIA